MQQLTQPPRIICVQISRPIFSTNCFGLYGLCKTAELTSNIVAPMQCKFKEMKPVASISKTFYLGGKSNREIVQKKRKLNKMYRDEIGNVQVAI